MKPYLLAVALLFSFISTSSADKVHTKSVLSKKGMWSFFYGYNRASYSNSDYHLTGNGYDFTLRDVAARDGQSGIDVEPYATPWGASTPQNTTRFGYYLTDDIAISFGNDHMKYIMIQDQTVGINGTIDASASATHAGTYSGSDTKKLDGTFLSFEHTDGLNFVSVELEHFIPLWINPSKTRALTVLYGPGIAVMYPRTNATLFGRGRHDEFNVAGHGYSIKAGLEYNFTHHLFARLVVKHGHINMPNVRTTSNSSDKLSHKFDFKETYLVLGINY